MGAGERRLCRAEPAAKYKNLNRRFPQSKQLQEKKKKLFTFSSNFLNTQEKYYKNGKLC